MVLKKVNATALFFVPVPLVFYPVSYYGFLMTLTIDVKNSGVLTLPRDMERLDPLRVTTCEQVSPAPVLKIDRSGRYAFV
ncbi:MAG: hypothetical protein LBK13_07785, partial [Spirochaetales bacterium]|nr:hypothetical protein [Spirochaetales bacterium]